MSLEWKLRKDAAGSHHEGTTVTGRYAARVRRDPATGWFIAEYKVGAGGDAYAQVEGDFKTAKAAKECASRRYYLAQEDAARVEREAGYPLAKAHAAKSGAEFAAAVMACKGRGYDVLALQGRNGEAARRAFRCHAPYGSGDMWKAYEAEWRLHYRAARGFPSAVASLAQRADMVEPDDETPDQHAARIGRIDGRKHSIREMIEPAVSHALYLSGIEGKTSQEAYAAAYRAEAQRRKNEYMGGA